MLTNVLILAETGMPRKKYVRKKRLKNRQFFATDLCLDIIMFLKKIIRKISELNASRLIPKYYCSYLTILTDTITIHSTI